MMTAHVHFNIGTFFDKFSDSTGLGIATSKRIKDFYWNYGFSLSGSRLSGPDLQTIAQALSKEERAPAAWQLGTDPVPPGWSIQSEESWMWIDSHQWRHRNEQAPRPVETQTRATPTKAMLHVFNDAYSSEQQPGDVGYFELPTEYGTAYLASTATGAAQVKHFALLVDHKPVAVAMGAVWKGWGGLYSVATLHGYRKRGLGRLVSCVATNWMISAGAQRVLLQTAADSSVENMYRSLGFERSHLGVLIAPSAQ